MLAVGLGLAAVSIGAASYALSPVAPASALERAPGARHPVLLMNLRSGGGKAEMAQLRGGGTRERLDRGVLGIASPYASTRLPTAEKLVALEARG